MKQKAIVAVVGRPNVGKSSLFNRLIKQRKAIVDDTPGLTRDRIYGTTEWLTREFILIDTGGLTDDKIPFGKEIRYQTNLAIEEADLIIFLVDAKNGLTQQDRVIAHQLHTTKKPIIIAANKYDNSQTNKEGIYDFLQLGFGEPLLISVTHGIGIGDLLDKVVANLPSEKDKKLELIPSIAIIGKPNVGKSSLVNQLLGHERMIVSEIPGTTIDTVDSVVQYNKKQYLLIDTAGLRRKGKLSENLEKYSYIRTLKIINQADIVLLMIDVSEPISNLDKNIGGLAFAEHKPVIILANKWDLIKNKDSNSRNKIEKEIRSHFKYLQYAQFLFTTNKNKTQIAKLYDLIQNIDEARTRKISTSILNEIINRAQLLNPPPEHNKGRLKIYYGTQLEADIPTFMMFVNNPDYLHFSYRRFLENQIRLQSGLSGVPLKLIFKERR